jgi:predicted 2-oxoglutarate/Fe(II)-dependent dioxygenase YbiX
MTPYRYRQPTIGQPYINLVEGKHQTELTPDGCAGRYLVICCFGSSRIDSGRAALDAVRRHEAMFDDVKVSLLAITLDAQQTYGLEKKTGIHFFLDRDGLFSRHCGAAPVDDVPLGMQYRVTWTIVDPTLHVLAHFHTSEEDSTCEAVFTLLSRQPDPDSFGGCEIPAPILVLPHVFDTTLCDRLVALYETGQPRDSGFMRRNQEIFDHSFKRRRDYFIEDEAVKKIILRRVSLTAIPEIRKLFFMQITRMERYLVGCYAAEEHAHFGPHRDNGQTITAHRRFALSVALNEDYEGGELQFPEYNRRPHRVPKGWGIVFPCAILHVVTRVTGGRRYAFLPFLFDEEGSRIQAAARSHL